MGGLYHTLLPTDVYYTTFSIPIIGSYLGFRCAMTTVTGQTFSEAWQVYKALQEAFSVPMKP